MSYKPTSIPNLPASVDPALRQFLSSVKEALEVRLNQRGSALDAAPTFRDLIDAGILNIKDGVSIGGRSYTSDQLLGLLEFTLPAWITSDTAPGAPTGLVVMPSGAIVKLEWNESTSPEYATTEIWRADSNNLTSAVRVGSTTGTTYIDSLPDAEAAYFYWIRDVSRNGLASSFNDVNGAPTIAGASAPVVSYAFSGPDIVLSWPTPTSNLTIQFYKIEVQSGATWSTLDIVGGNVYRTRVNWLGSKQIRVRAVDVSGNEGTPGSITAVVSAPAAPSPSSSFSVDSVVLRWPASTGGSLPASTYRIYDTSISPSNLLADQLSTVFTTKVSWSSKTFVVTTVDTAGNESVGASVTATVANPTTPTVTASIDGENIRVTWSSTANSLGISYYNLRYGASYASGVPVTSLSGNSFVTRADWTGARTFWVAAVDFAGNESTAGYTSVTINPPSTVAPTASVSGVTAVLSWPAATATLPIVSYEVRHGASWAAGTLVTRVSATTTSVAINWTGARTFWVAAVDSLGNMGTAGSATLTINTPSAPTVTSGFAGPNCVLTWTASASTLPVSEYEIRYGATWAGGTVIGRVKSTTYTTIAAWIGERQFWVAAVDQNGNVGTPSSTSVSVASAPAPILSAEVIDNNVLLRWNEVQGSLPTETYELRRGASWSSAFVIGNKSGAFTTVFETAAGQYTYWLAAVDTAGNYGTPTSVVTTVASPPDYVLAANYSSTFAGTKSNAFIDGTDNTLVMPVNTTQTWTTHFTSRSWTKPQDQINAGYPVFIQPGSTTGYYEEVNDYGSVLAAMKITVDYLKTIISGTVNETITITTALDAAFTTNVQTVTARQAYCTNFRYVKVRVTATATDDKGVMRLSGLTIKLDAKLKTFTGTITANSSDAGGTTVYLTEDRTSTGTKYFIDVDSINTTPAGTTAAIAIYDFTDAPNPLTFKVLLFNTSGTRISGIVSYIVRGY